MGPVHEGAWLCKIGYKLNEKYEGVFQDRHLAMKNRGVNNVQLDALVKDVLAGKATEADVITFLESLPRDERQRLALRYRDKVKPNPNQNPLTSEGR